MSLKEEIKEIVKEFRTIDFEGMTLDELATDKELNELTDKILALEPFQKLERVYLATAYIKDKISECDKMIIESEKESNKNKEIIHSVIKFELEQFLSILSENEKAEG